MEDLSQREELAQQQLNSLRDSYQAMQQKHQGMEIENQKLSIQMHTMRDGSAQLQVKIDEQKDQISSPTTIKESDLESARAEVRVCVSRLCVVQLIKRTTVTYARVTRTGQSLCN